MTTIPPDREWEEDRECPVCEEIRHGWCGSFADGRAYADVWWICGVCGCQDE